MKKWIVKYEENVYLLSDEKVEYGDNYLLVSKEDEAVLEEPWPSSKSSYNKRKVIWFYEKDHKLVRCDKSAEDELSNLLVEELTREIDQQILQDILATYNATKE
jgi:hypothetical protein